MRLLLDTHVLLWWMADDPSLPREVREHISARATLVYVSAVSVWEIVIKRSLGKIELPDEWEKTLAAEPFRRLPVTWEHAFALHRLPPIHRDPFDRLLIAQAELENLTLVTRDSHILRYGIRTLPA